MVQAKDGFIVIEQQLLGKLIPLLTNSKSLVFFSIALSCDQQGIARCSTKDIMKATGLGKDTVQRVVGELLAIRYEDKPILLRRLIKDSGNRYGRSQYVVLPYHQESEVIRQ